MGKQLTIKDVRNLKIRLARQARDEWAVTVKIIKDFKENYPDSVIEVSECIFEIILFKKKSFSSY